MRRIKLKLPATNPFKNRTVDIKKLRKALPKKRKKSKLFSKSTARETSLAARRKNAMQNKELLNQAKQSAKFEKGQEKAFRRQTGKIPSSKVIKKMENKIKGDSFEIKPLRDKETGKTGVGSLGQLLYGSRAG